MTLSATGMVDAFKERSSVAWRVLLTIAHPDLAQPLRLVDGRADVTSNGNLFSAYPFEFILAGSDGTRALKSRLRIDNVDRQVFQSIWGLDPAPTVSAEIVLSSTPNVVEFSSVALRLERIDVDALYIEGDLAPRDIAVEPYPGRTFSPQNFPGLF